MISFKFTRPKFVYGMECGQLARRLVMMYMPVNTDNTISKGTDMHSTDEPAPGEALKEWLELSGMSASAFSRLVPCSVSLPGQWARGDARPSYEMARRIEHLTDNMVPRTLWYPPGEQLQQSTDIEDLI